MSNAETPQPVGAVSPQPQTYSQPTGQPMPAWPPTGQDPRNMWPQPGQTYPGYQYPGYAPAPQDNNRGCLIVIAAFGFFTMLLITAGLLFYVIRGSNPVDPVDPVNPIGTRFDADVRSAMVGTEASLHAVYLEKLMRAKAGIIAADALAEGEAEINTHAEVLSLIRKFGRFGLSGTEARVYPGLPGVADKAVTLLFGKDKDGNVQGGDFTPEERRQAVILFNEMADAFKKVQ